MLDFRVQTFLEVCRDMNFTRAAKRLSLTQPAVSQHIRWLEECYGVKLFSYQGKKLSLTEAGELLKDAGATMEHDVASVRERMQESTRTKRKLKMGLTLTIAEYEISRSVAAYLNRDPDCSMLLSVGNTEKLLRELEEGIIDFALVEGNFPREIYESLPYSRERYIAVCGREDTLAEGHCTLDGLLDRRLVTRESGSGTRNILERYLALKSLEVTDFSALVEAGNIDLIKQLVEYGCGITFLYRTAVKKELEEGRLCEIRVEDVNITHDFTFIWRKDSIFGGEYRRLCETFRKQ